MLYSAQSSQGRGNLVLRHSVFHFPPRHCVLSGVTQRRALPRHQSVLMKIYILIKYFIPLAWGSNPLQTDFSFFLFTIKAEAIVALVQKRAAVNVTIVDSIPILGKQIFSIVILLLWQWGKTQLSWVTILHAMPQKFKNSAKCYSMKLKTKDV